MRRLVTFWALMTALCVYGQPLQAQSLRLDDTTVPVVHRASRPSGAKFGSGQAGKEMMAINAQGIQAPESILQALRFHGVTYDRFALQLPPGAGTYDVLPACSADRVRKSEVLADSEDLQWFDLLFYNYREGKQSARAEAWELPAAPYLEGDLYNPHRIRDMQQELGRLFQVQCLPTRFHFVTLNGQRYLEYREGERAWDRLPDGGAN